MKRLWWLNPVHPDVPGVIGGLIITAYMVVGGLLLLPPVIWFLQNPVRWWFEYWLR